MKMRALTSLSRPACARRVVQRRRRCIRRLAVRHDAIADDDDARTGRRRDALALGDVVEIKVVGTAAVNGATVTGAIADFVTNASFHADGIKVRLECGAIGRVSRRTDAPAAARASDEISVEVDDEVEEKEEEDESSAESIERVASSSGTSGTGRAVRTAHVSGVSKSADASTAKSLADGLKGVKRVRLPTRAGAHMGYMFIECDDADALRGVVEALNGVEFEGKRLNVEPAKEDPRPKEKKKTIATASKQKPQKSKKTRSELEAENKERRILEARAQMEADALLELERAKRRRERELERKEREIQSQRELEIERERRAKAVLERRAAASKARAERARAQTEAREARDAAAAALGDIRLDASWRARVDELRASLDRLRVDADAHVE